MKNMHNKAADADHARRERKKVNKIKSLLAAVVALVSAYMLILPAVTMENASCGYEEHTHTEQCYVYAPVSALSLEELGENDVQVCGLTEGEGHTHGDGCYDENGEIVCTLGEYDAHTHEISCYNTRTVVCVYVEHVHTEECYSQEGTSQSIQDETDTQGSAVSSDADEIVHGQESLVGKFRFDPGYKYYQVSPKGVAASDIMTFVLIPDELYSDSWIPSGTNWSAKADVNYTVAYCAEPLVTIPSGADSYDSYTIDNSRFATAELRSKLSGIISHSYPYITYDEMRGELSEAFENGEISTDVSGCSVGEFMAATQIALWKTVYPEMVYGAFGSADISKYSDVTVNPLEDTGCTDFRNHCTVIMQWLMTKTGEEELSVADCSHEVVMDEYGLYSLTVNARFNRAIIAGEVVTMQLCAGDMETSRDELPAGSDSFTVSLEGLTYNELMDSVVDLRLSGQKIQAYYFDNPTYQDLVGGQWESYEEDLSFNPASETTSVSVTKHWAEDDIPEDMTVSVALYANGNKVAETAVLSSACGWEYTWTELDKYDSLGEAIEYTVRESPVNGYYTNISPAEGQGGSVNVWEEATGFADGERYMLVADSGGLGAYALDQTTDALAWDVAYPGDYAKCGEGLVWTAKQADNGEFYLYNACVDGTLGYRDLLNDMYYRVRPVTDEAKYMTFVFADGKLTGTYGDADGLDFSYIGINGGVRGCGYFRDYTGAQNNYAESFTLYRLSEKELPPADINYLITNTGIGEDVEKIGVSVTKEWKGREDNVYPGSVQVQLMQNGREYDEVITLNAENNLTVLWENLPKTDNEGNPFEYTVTEKDVVGYDSEQSGAMGEDGIYAISLVNTWNPEKIPVMLNKTDKNTGAFLSGAEFNLYLATNNTGDVIDGTDGVRGQFVEKITVGEQGTAQMNLAAGEIYYLTEIKAPAGYELLSAATAISVTKRENYITVNILTDNGWAEATSGLSASVTIKNITSYRLPKTGGAGTGWFIFAGVLLMGFALYGTRKIKKAF